MWRKIYKIVYKTCCCYDINVEGVQQFLISINIRVAWSMASPKHIIRLAFSNLIHIYSIHTQAARMKYKIDSFVVNKYHHRLEKKHNENVLFDASCQN